MLEKTNPKIYKACSSLINPIENSRNNKMQKNLDVFFNKYI